MQILREFLNAFWLRPEVALIKTHEYLALKQLHVNEPSLDIGCGDGIFSFISSGGRFGLGFDMYQNVKGTDQFFKGVDVFDHFDENDFTIDIVQKPNEQITYGLDHKATLLAKASKLGLYKNTIHSDANESIPLKSNSINTVFCNILYILEEVDGLLNETHRILSDSGRFILQLPERRAEEAMVHHFYKNYGWEWAKLIDREKYAITYPPYHKHEREYWDELLSRAGFGIVEEVKLRPDLVHIMWDIGLRPLFPALMEMYRRLGDTDRLEVKRVWVDTLYEVLVHFCKPDWMYENMNCAPTFRMVSLEKI